MDELPRTPPASGTNSSPAGRSAHRASAELCMTIGATRVRTAVMDVVSPATGGVFASAPDCTAAQLDDAIAAAAHAQAEWASDESQRRQAMHRCADVLDDAAPEIALLLTQEQGKPLAESQREVDAARAWFSHYATLPVAADVVRDDDRARVVVQRRPLGVVAAFTPWNYPVMLAGWKLAPALLAGNTVVLKPSPITPLSSLRMGAALAEVLPPGVVNVISGGDALGPLLSSHPVPRKLTFTGSTATGRHVMSSAAPTLKRLTLELGGNDPALLLDDIDVERVAPKVFAAAFANNGQTCVAVKRVLAPASLVEDLLDALVAIARDQVVGDGLDPATQLGPLTTDAQRQRVDDLVRRARADGASVLTGGEVPNGPGFFYAPTIVSCPTAATPLVAEEQFGPSLPVVPYTSLEQAIAMGNGTDYGLGASVWSADADRAETVAEQLDAGAVWTNTHAALAPGVPFAGMGSSGVGVANGRLGYEEFTQVRSIHISKPRRPTP